MRTRLLLPLVPPARDGFGGLWDYCRANYGPLTRVLVTYVLVWCVFGQVVDLVLGPFPDLVRLAADWWVWSQLAVPLARKLTSVEVDDEA